MPPYKNIYIQQDSRGTIVYILFWFLMQFIQNMIFFVGTEICTVDFRNWRKLKNPNFLWGPEFLLNQQQVIKNMKK